MRAILDGHIVLSRELAQQGHYPAIDVLRSASRVMSRLASDEERRLAADAARHLAVLEKNRQLVELGAYVKGANAALDAALAREAALSAWLRQDGAGVGRDEALRALSRVLASGAAA
jgi:flagellum-specific ATP synthase